MRLDRILVHEIGLRAWLSLADENEGRGHRQGDPSPSAVLARRFAGHQPYPLDTKEPR